MLHDELLDLKTQVITLYLKKRFRRADSTAVRQALVQAESMERTYDLLLTQYSSQLTSWDKLQELIRRAVHWFKAKRFQR